MAMSIERLPELGRKPVSLTVKLPPLKGQDADHMTEGLRELFRRGELTDITLCCAERTFHAHRIVLAAQSEVFREGLARIGEGKADAKEEIRLADVANPEAVKFMLDFMYQMDDAQWGRFNPRTQEINKDVLRLAQNFKLTGLRDRAMHWLAKDITTGNVVERLTICEDFGLQELLERNEIPSRALGCRSARLASGESQRRERILQQLTYNKQALAEVAHSPQIMTYPKLMQAMLQLAAAAKEDGQPPKKRGRCKA